MSGRVDSLIELLVSCTIGLEDEVLIRLKENVEESERQKRKLQEKDTWTRQGYKRSRHRARSGARCSRESEKRERKLQEKVE